MRCNQWHGRQAADPLPADQQMAPRACAGWARGDGALDNNPPQILEDFRGFVLSDGWVPRVGTVL